VAGASDKDTTWRDWVIVTLMSLTTILAAWSAFESSKWSGSMSISFSQASTARIEAARYNGDANRVISVQVGLFTAWANAYSGGDERQTTYLASNFPEPLKSAFDAWLAADPEANAEVPRTPFEMPQYQLADQASADEADERADAKFAEALDSNQTSDNYTILAVLFAVVLFFSALGGRARSASTQGVYLALALGLFVVTAGFLASFPKLI
jgi:hypothetical protein